MSDTSIASGCLVHYNDQHIQVRRDFFDLCAYNKDDFNQKVTRNGKKAKDEPNQECMAKILRLFETLTNHEKTEWHLKAEKLKARGIKPPNEPKEYRIELAYSTISNLLYSTYGESAIRNSIAVLLQRGYIKRYQKAKNSIPCYALDIKALQAALDKQAQESMQESAAQEATTDEVSNSTGGVSKVSNSTDSPSNSTPETRQGDSKVSNSTPNNISKIDDKKDGKNEDLPTHSSVPSLSLFFSPEEERVYNFAKEKHLSYLKRDENHREHCAILVDKGVTTLEKMQSLMQFCQQRPYLVGKDLCLGNLVSELNGWLQVQPSTTPAKSTSKEPSQLDKLKAARRRAEESRLREEAQAGGVR